MKYTKNLYEILPLILILGAFILPFCILYYIDPTSFSRTWTGRTYYMFFLWLIFLEIILEWEKITQSKLSLKAPRTLLFVAFSFLPTTYVMAMQFLGLESALWRMADWLGVPFAPIPRQPQTYGEWTLSLEYLVFTVLFAATVWLAYHKEGLKVFSSPLLFVGTIGTIYLIDTLYPFGYFVPLQAFVPLTASLAAGVLNWVGYQTAFTSQIVGAPVLAAYDSSGRLLIQYAVGWPCAGVQSLLIYTFVMLIFLKRTAISPVQKIGYFVVGAFITYGLNILRIVSIYLTYINNLSRGVHAAQAAADLFHNYYGGLYAMVWVVTYPLVIIGSRMLWDKIRNQRFQIKLFHRSTQPESGTLIK